MTTKEQVERLMSLEPNWDGYGAPAIDRKAIERVALMVDCFPCEPCRLVPTSAGSVQIEIERGDKELELEFDGLSIDYLKWNGREQDGEGGTVKLADAVEIHHLLDWVNS